MGVAARTGEVIHKHAERNPAIIDQVPVLFVSADQIVERSMQVATAVGEGALRIHDGLVRLLILLPLDRLL